VIGQLVGSYRVVRALGEGGMGVVYLAEHTQLRRFAAIKMLQPKLSRRADMVRRFFDEARAATAIAHPGIVQVHDVGFRPDGAAYIVMEALVGEALDRRLRRFGRVPATTALRVARQLAVTLRAAHAAGIVHCDLKPENIFLVADPAVAGGERAKVLDFGVARLMGDDPRVAGSALGTPLYMAPEQCRGAIDIDARTDVYALGCVLYHLLVGRPPFVAEASETVLAMHLYDNASPPSVVLPVLGGALDTLVMRCLAKAPADRYSGMDDVIAEIDRRLSAVATAEAEIALGSSDNLDLASVSARWLTPSQDHVPATTPPKPQRRILRWWRRRRGLDGGATG
jgi:eukaryotic-like serine/threonine-protein kinase